MHSNSMSTITRGVNPLLTSYVVDARFRVGARADILVHVTERIRRNRKGSGKARCNNSTVMSEKGRIRSPVECTWWGAITLGKMACCRGREETCLCANLQTMVVPESLSSHGPSHANAADHKVARALVVTP